MFINLWPVCKMLTFISKNKFLLIFAFWILISPFYYFWNFYTGNLISDIDEGLLHRLLKYFVSIFICVLFFLKRPNLTIIYLYSLLSIVWVVFLLFEFEGFDTRIQVALLLVLISFSGFMLLPSYMTDAQLVLILNVVVISAIFVSLISFYEYFFMWPVLGDYWNATGGYRSVSTMLNPNNLGVYLGVSLLILFLHKGFSVFWRVLAIAIILAALLMSGSRTAVVSILVPVFLGFVFSSGGKVRVGFLIAFIFASIFLLFFIAYFLTSDLMLSGRYLSSETAMIRLDKYFAYISMVDFSYVIPDFNFTRSFFVSENSYFYLLNTFGVALTVVVVVCYLTIFRINWRFTSESGVRRILALIVLYYIICFLFENMISSFPNNQFFFFALGAILLPRRIDSRTRGCYV